MTAFPSQQRGAANIDIKINTTKELVSDIGHDRDSDMVDSSEVRHFVSALPHLFIFAQYFQTSDGRIPDSGLEGKVNVV